MRRKRVGRALPVMVIVVIGGSSGCPQIQPLTPSADVTGVTPGAASPGVLVRVACSAAVFSATDNTTRVEIGGEAAAISEVISPTEADVAVPTLEAGVADVRVVERGKAPGGTTPLTIIAPAAQQLVLNFANERVSLISAMPTTGSPTDPGQEIGSWRISYDVLSGEGNLLFTGAVNHPARGRREVYQSLEGTGAAATLDIRRAPTPPSTAFSIRILNVPGGAKVRFFEAEPGLDLGTEEGRGARIPLNEITVGG